VLQSRKFEVFKEHLTALLVSLGSRFFFFFCGEIVFIPRKLSL
jgi:hypothetical protein